MKYYLGGIFLTVAVCLLGLYFIYPARQTIVYYDKGKIIVNFAQSLSAHSVPVNKQEKLVKRMAHALTKAVATLVESKHYVFINKSSVVAGALDVTDELELKIACQLSRQRGV